MVLTSKLLAQTDLTGNILSEFVYLGDALIARNEGVPNPGFENGSSSWSTSAYFSVVTDASKAHSGSKYAQLSTSLNAFTYSSLIVPVVPGQVVTFGGWVYRESGNGWVRWNLKVMDSSMTPFAYRASFNAGSGVWEYNEKVYTIPANGAYVQLYADMYQATGPSVARFDDGFVNASVRYSISDHLGTSRIVTDAKGTACYDADFYPYGGERAYASTCPPPLKFTGYEYDSESGFYYAMARYYDVGRGRFISADPLGGSAGNPQGHNGYAYVLNNPANLIDPFGLSADCFLGPCPDDPSNPPPCFINCGSPGPCFGASRQNRRLDLTGVRSPRIMCHPRQTFPMVRAGIVLLLRTHGLPLRSY